ncbi:hypothetical protein AVEN_40544-1 [Araneus ventricosus]|uniref:Histone-lysine N-methyltransferase SETMAR n=1 Tax=Araneus ventricosus TaxID=182803 RepID=A0A4Y2VBQ3_ARAVE|nr:hypothetical protein AVEN_40544-1 [Araneus ventricosus]
MRSYVLWSRGENEQLPLVPSTFSTRSCLLPNNCEESGAVFIQDYSLPHSALVTQQLLEQFKWDLSDHVAYSPDLAPSDFHLFSELKNWSEGQSFQSNEKLQSNAKAHLTSLAAMFFEEGIEKLLH